MKVKTIRRGDLFYYDFGNNPGSIQCGERPVLVLQDDDYNNNAPTIVVAALTSVVKKRYLPSHIVLGEDFGLKKSSMVLLEQMRTINKSELQEYIGVHERPKKASPLISKYPQLKKHNLVDVLGRYGYEEIGRAHV